MRSIAAGAAGSVVLTVCPLSSVVVYVPALAARTESVVPDWAAPSAVVLVTTAIRPASRPRLSGLSLSAMTVVASRPRLTCTVTVSPVRVYWAIGVILPLKASSVYGVPAPSSVTSVSTAAPVAMHGLMPTVPV